MRQVSHNSITTMGTGIHLNLSTWRVKGTPSHRKCMDKHGIQKVISLDSLMKSLHQQIHAHILLDYVNTQLWLVIYPGATARDLWIINSVNPWVLESNYYLVHTLWSQDKDKWLYIVTQTCHFKNIPTMPSSLITVARLEMTPDNLTCLDKQNFEIKISNLNIIWQTPTSSSWQVFNSNVHNY